MRFFILMLVGIIFIAMGLNTVHTTQELLALNGDIIGYSMSMLLSLGMMMVGAALMYVANQPKA